MGDILDTRLAGLCDPGSLEQCLAHTGSLYFTGFGQVDGRRVMIVAADPEPPPQPPDLPASLARAIAALRLAGEAPCPVVSLFDPPAPYQSGHTAFQGSQIGLMMGDQGVGRQYYEYCRLARRVPLVSAVFGNMAQAQAFPVAMGHGVVMLKDSALSVARPDAVKTMLGEDLTYQELGGARLHSRETGSCHQVVTSQDEALAWVRGFLSFLPAHGGELPPTAEPASPPAGVPPLESLIPARLNQPFDVHTVIGSLVDEGGFLELGARYGGEVVTGLARLAGLPAGLLANNPKVRGGMLFPETCRKMIRFIDLCDTFNLPLVFLADAPGFMIGQAAEKGGIVQAGADLFSRIALCRVPRLCLVLRRAYTAGMYAMGGSGFDPTALYALPDASISVYGPEAVERFLANLDMPPEQKEVIRSQMVEASQADTLVKQGYLTGVLPHAQAREAIARFVEQARTDMGCELITGG